MAVQAVSFPDYQIAREKMVKEQLVDRGITDGRVLETMSRLPRHLFLDREAGPQAYSDHPFPIGFSQSMSQPYMVAYLAEQLALEGNDKVLEIGTGSGYQAAVLAAASREVYSIERIQELAAQAVGILHELRIHNVRIRVADGSHGWKEVAPFDRILLTAAAKDVPRSLLMQLRDGGFFLGPVVNNAGQEIVKMTRRGTRFAVDRLKACSFVPMVREEGRRATPPMAD